MRPSTTKLIHVVLLSIAAILIYGSIFVPIPYIPTLNTSDIWMEITFKTLQFIAVLLAYNFMYGVISDSYREFREGRKQ
jgi:hypothetical protein